MMSCDRKSGRKVSLLKGSLRPGGSMIDPRAAMQPGLKAGGAFSDVVQESRKCRVASCAKRFRELFCQLCGSQQMRFHRLLSSVFSNMRKIFHHFLQNFVVFYKFIVIPLPRDCKRQRNIFGSVRHLSVLHFLKQPIDFLCLLV